MQHVHSGFLKLALTASILLGVGLAVTPAIADPVTFHFQGIVDHVDSPLSFGSNALSGSFTFDSATPNSTPASSQIGTYSNSISNLTFTIGSYTSTTNGSPILNSSIIVVNDNFQADQFLMSTPLSPGGSPSPLTFEMNLFLGHAFGNDFANTSLPTLPPSLGGLNGHPIGDALNPFTPFRIAFDGNLIASGRISLVATPLPPAVILFGAGLVALIGLGARNWRREARARIA